MRCSINYHPTPRHVRPRLLHNYYARRPGPDVVLRASLHVEKEVPQWFRGCACRKARLSIVAVPKVALRQTVSNIYVILPVTWCWSSSVQTYYLAGLKYPYLQIICVILRMRAELRRCTQPGLGRTGGCHSLLPSAQRKTKLLRAFSDFGTDSLQLVGGHTACLVLDACANGFLMHSTIAVALSCNVPHCLLLHESACIR